MKTYQDCKEKVAKSKYGYTWSYFAVTYTESSIVFALGLAAELYGRYMRFVGRAQMREEERVRRENIHKQRKEPQTDLPDDLFLLTL